ncbi:MAG: hypothetical protein OK422_05695 [Thaumarchaeota archaeon]|nr:hypothetical protein [Nitrososphaerota archaeon]
MSKVENPANDAKKLALRYKALEAQLQQSVSKKQYNETVSKLEGKNTEQEKDLARTKAELQKTSILNKQFASIGEQIAALGKAVGAQSKTIDSLMSKIIQGTVPSSVHHQTVSKVRELEEKIEDTVNKAEYATMERRYEEAARKISNMVPSSEYNALKDKVEEMEGTISSMVPREQFSISEARAKELEAKLAEHVPQSTYDELVSKVVLLAEEVTGGAPAREEQETAAQTEPEEPQSPVMHEPVPSEPYEVPGQEFTEPEAVKVEATFEARSAEAQPASEPATQEIREIQSQLAEISTNEATQKNPTEESPKEGSTFRFFDTIIEVKTGTEFAKVLTNVPTKSLESDVQSGEFEKWFRDTLSDDTTAESFKKMRESGTSGEELRNQVASAVSKFVVQQEKPIQTQAAETGN